MYTERALASEEIASNKLVFDIFHKPTHADSTIHNASLRPFSHKHAAFFSYVHRIINVPLSEDKFQEELNLI